ncbi:MAG: hypothetical protein KAH17_05595 [Bacteroidales bacterium]|nr:hypothetical protein [Bacteroidales bacterium]
MKKLFTIVIALLFITQLGLNAQTLLAHYPLISNGVDSTGNNADMTMGNAPFQNGGIYSNGIYSGSDTTGSYFYTPQIANINLDDLTINVEFLIEEYPEHSMPIIMAGSSWRWLSAWMDGDKIALKVNNGRSYEVSTKVVDLDQWYSVSISYKKADGKAMLHLDDVLILSIDEDELNHHDYSRIVNSDGGIGNAYKGYWRNLKVYDASIVNKIDDELMDRVSIKPFGNQIQVDVPFEDKGVNLQMFDMSGRILGEQVLKPGRTVLDAPKGNNIIMFVLTDQKGNRLTKRLAFSN